MSLIFISKQKGVGGGGGRGVKRKGEALATPKGKAYCSFLSERKIHSRRAEQRRPAAQLGLKIYFHTRNQDALWRRQRPPRTPLLACARERPRLRLSLFLCVGECARV